MKKTYGCSMKINKQNSKLEGSNIYNGDTIRGCPNGCVACYSNWGSSRSIAFFNIPVKITEFKGRIYPERNYRLGNSGDPAIDWAHSEKLIKESGMLKFFVVTKLQKINGFTGFFNKLQVSLDPFNKVHLQRTMENIVILLNKFPDIKIVVRIRSVKTLDANLAYQQQRAVIFANQYNLPVLETRMRFDDNAAIEKYKLDPKFYRWDGKLRPALGKRILTGVNKLYDCDLKEVGCVGCKNCDVPFNYKPKEKTNACATSISYLSNVPQRSTETL